MDLGTDSHVCNSVIQKYSSAPTVSLTRPRILLTDTNRWPSPSRLAIGLSAAGCEPSAVCSAHHPLLFTRAVRKTYPYNAIHPLEALVAAIDDVDPQVIIPCDDRGVLHLHELHHHVQSMGENGLRIAALIERSLGAPDSFATVASRFDLLQLAVEEGIRVPETRLIKTVDDLKFLRAGHEFPWVLKADGTFGGRGVRIAETYEEAIQFFREMDRPHPTARVIKRLLVNRDPFWVRTWWHRTRPAVITQAHVKGRPANCAVVCWEGKVLAGIGVVVVNCDGLTGPASVVRVVDNPEMMRAAERIAARLRLSGFFGLDFMIEDQTNLLYLIEMNPRCTPLCHLQLGKGRDLIGAFAAQLSGQPFQETPPVTENDLIAYFPQAWTSKNELLQASFQDVPQHEPELVQELLSPWPERNFLFRLASFGAGLTAPRDTRKSAASPTHTR